MKSYMHPHSSNDWAMEMTDSQIAMYDAIRAGRPIHVHTRTHYTANDMEVVAERLRSDEYAALIPGARVIDRMIGDTRYAQTCITVSDGDVGFHKLNSAAALRIVDRLRSGLPVAEAIARTFAECEKPVYTPAQEAALVERLDRETARELHALANTESGEDAILDHQLAVSIAAGAPDRS